MLYDLFNFVISIFQNTSIQSEGQNEFIGDKVVVLFAKLGILGIFINNWWYTRFIKLVKDGRIKLSKAEDNDGGKRVLEHIFGKKKEVEDNPRSSAVCEICEARMKKIKCNQQRAKSYAGILNLISAIAFTIVFLLMNSKPIGLLLSVIILLLIIIIFYGLFHKYITKFEEEKNKLKWLAIGGAIPVLMISLLNMYSNDPNENILWIINIYMLWVIYVYFQMNQYRKTNGFT
ncbi:MAG: hypothetical protein NPIRA05_08450 [Nitrospirales bacterium]|nr:MAG: hypothetical protein NPIRA05_08450 [Nitrospirales bacterium]